jgi:hypothetical protein
MKKMSKNINIFAISMLQYLQKDLVLTKYANSMEPFEQEFLLLGGKSIVHGREIFTCRMKETC